MRNPVPVEALYDRAWRSAMDAAIAAGGTLSHHHGVGRSKAPALGAEKKTRSPGAREPNDEHSLPSGLQTSTTSAWTGAAFS